ncbi:MAG: alpha/beta hydrolase [Candidatus Kapabacteria bacterium]|nr:alpha/beta hydrolase [Candidatus Kapabacteria bacterium]
MPLRLASPFLTALALLTAILTVSCSRNPSDIGAANYTKVTVAYKTVRGVDPNLLSLDVYHFGQSSTPKPVVVYVHGGGFAIGDKANSMQNKTSLFSSLGYIFVSINYRLSPEKPSTDTNRVMYPTHHNDVADAVQWVYANIAQYGGNPSKIALLGHSAGAQLVSLTGTSQLFLPARNIPLSTIKGVASIDTEGYDVTRQGREGNEVYLNAFGSNPRIWAEASPINNVQAGVSYPRFFIAKRGTMNRIGLADAFIAALERARVSVSQITANQYDHEGINDAIGAPGETVVTEPLKAFFAQCFQ